MSAPSSASGMRPGARSSRPQLLDLFCGAGGAAMGYYQAGFEVVGVDIKPQPRYPYLFLRGDALGLAAGFLATFDVIHASPPCQAYSTMKSLKHSRQHLDLIPATRAMLNATGLPWVMENVEGAPLNASLMLCGSMFGLKSRRGYLRRHRLFEFGNTDLLIMAPPCVHRGVAIGVYGHGSAGLLGQRMRTANRDEARELMGTPEMLRDGMSQAIPPAYTEWIGKQLVTYLTERPLVAARS